MHVFKTYLFNMFKVCGVWNQGVISQDTYFTKRPAAPLI